MNSAGWSACLSSSSSSFQPLNRTATKTRVLLVELYDEDLDQRRTATATTDLDQQQLQLAQLSVGGGPNSDGANSQQEFQYPDLQQPPPPPPAPQLWSAAAAGPTSATGRPHFGRGVPFDLAAAAAAAASSSFVAETAGASSSSPGSMVPPSTTWTGFDGSGQRAAAAAASQRQTMLAALAAAYLNALHSNAGISSLAATRIMQQQQQQQTDADNTNNNNNNNNNSNGNNNHESTAATMHIGAHLTHLASLIQRLHDQSSALLNVLIILLGLCFGFVLTRCLLFRSNDSARSSSLWRRQQLASNSLSSSSSSAVGGQQATTTTTTTTISRPMRAHHKRRRHLSGGNNNLQPNEFDDDDDDDDDQADTDQMMNNIDYDESERRQIIGASQVQSTANNDSKWTNWHRIDSWRSILSGPTKLTTSGNLINFKSAHLTDLESAPASQHESRRQQSDDDSGCETTTTTTAAKMGAKCCTASQLIDDFDSTSLTSGLSGGKLDSLTQRLINRCGFKRANSTNSQSLEDSSSSSPQATPKSNGGGYIRTIMSSLTRRNSSLQEQQQQVVNAAVAPLNGAQFNEQQQHCEEQILVSQMDISAAHLILDYMEKHLDDKERLRREWLELNCGASAPLNSNIAAKANELLLQRMAKVALSEQNAHKNLNLQVLPFDRNRVKLGSKTLLLATEGSKDGKVGTTTPTTTKTTKTTTTTTTNRNPFQSKTAAALAAAAANKNPTKASTNGTNAQDDMQSMTMEANNNDDDYDYDDYINASFIYDDDPRRPTHIIAQAPSEQTSGHFWQMIWEQEVGIIVMLTRLNENGQKLCHRYWPAAAASVAPSLKWPPSQPKQQQQQQQQQQPTTLNSDSDDSAAAAADPKDNDICRIGSSEQSGRNQANNNVLSFELNTGTASAQPLKLELHLVSEHVCSNDYLVRNMFLVNKQTGETRTLSQFHYLAWPDTKVPQNVREFLQFRRKVHKSFRQPERQPILIHCSDGAGRSGTYALIDIILERIRNGAKEIDLRATLEHLREQRVGLCANQSQFEFVLVALAEEIQLILNALPQ